MSTNLDVPEQGIPEDRDLADRHHDDEDEERVATVSAKGEEKRKEGSSSSSLDEQVEPTEYPPGPADAVETRKVEETLRRWEEAERLRRKSARESYRGSTTQAGWKGFWTTTGQSRHSQLGGNHAALHSRESVENVPMDAVIHSPAISPGGSPKIMTASLEATNEHHSNNPFLSPGEISPFADSHRIPAVMNPSSPPFVIPQPSSVEEESALSNRPMLKASESSFTRPPPPSPLDLPPPRTPPPIEREPSPISAPTIHSGQRLHGQELETRWWHDWLCGCGEGPDRGGDFQAGRTNPNE